MQSTTLRSSLLYQQKFFDHLRLFLRQCTAHLRPLWMLPGCTKGQVAHLLSLYFFSALLSAFGPQARMAATWFPQSHLAAPLPSPPPPSHQPERLVCSETQKQGLLGEQSTWCPLPVCLSRRIHPRIHIIDETTRSAAAGQQALPNTHGRGGGGTNQNENKNKTNDAAATDTYIRTSLVVTTRRRRRRGRGS